MNYKNLVRVLSLLLLLTSFIPLNHTVHAAANLPPVNMFQLPWEQGLAWVALDGIDNGSKRPETSSHNYHLGGAIDFAPRNNMVTGEDTSNFWVTAAAAGTVVEVSGCHLKIAHANGWITEYQFLAKLQVKLGDVVARNQRVAIIADGVKYRYCPGYQEPNKPHLHFMLRPSLIGATLAGWEVRYSWFWNATTFRKDGKTVGLYKPLFNALDPQPTATPTTQPTATVTPSPVMSPTPTFVGPYVSTAVNPSSIHIGETTLVTVSLNNVPAEGYTSAEFTCPYDGYTFEVSNISVASLFGADAVSAINGPANGSFIVAIAGAQGNKATTSGVAFTFNIKGLQTGQAYLGCEARVSSGANVLTQLPSAKAYLTVFGDTPTPNTTPSSSPINTPTASSTPYPTPTLPTDNWLTFTNLTYGFEFKYPLEGIIADSRTNNFARIDLPFTPGTNLSEKYLEVLVAENVNPCQSPLATQSMLETSETVIVNGISFLKQTGGDAGAGNVYQWIAYSTLRDNTCVSLDFILHSHNPGMYTTPPPLFNYAAESAILGQMISTYAWLTLPPTATPTPSPACQTDTASVTLSTSSTTVNAGDSFKIVVTLNNEGCVTLGLPQYRLYVSPSGSDAPIVPTNPEPIVHSLGIGPAQSDSAEFNFQAVSAGWVEFTASTSYEVHIGYPGPAYWGSSSSQEPLRVQVVEPTSTLTGQVVAEKPVTVSLYDAGNTLVTSVSANPDGTFNLTIPVGTYTAIATANGFLSAQASVVLVAGNTTTLPPITLPGGDIDGNNIIDQFDAMTLGMSYNTAEPLAADLNSDGVINVLDLELLARNYRKTGPVVWQ